MTFVPSHVQHSFSFMDRGVVFKIVARYLDAFSVKENIVSLNCVCACVCVIDSYSVLNCNVVCVRVQHLSRLKLDFIRIVCDHEHFVPLNLPFPKSSESVETVFMATT